MHRIGTIHPIVLQGLQTVLSIDAEDIDGSQSFISLGGDSLGAVRLAAYCTERHLHVLVRDILQRSRVDEIGESSKKDAPPELQSIQAPAANGQSHSQDLMPSTLKPVIQSKPVQDNISNLFLPDEAALTDTQLRFLHENEVSPGTNIIRFCETYPSSALASVRRAWNIVIKQEDVFHPPVLNPGIHLSRDQWTEVKVNCEADYEAELVKANQAQTRLSCFNAVTWEKIEGDESISTVVWSVHHAFMDGYSAHLLHQKMIDVANGRIASPGPSFWTVAAELRELKLARQESTAEYWASQYTKFSSAAWEIDFPSPYSPPEKVVLEESALTFNFPSERISNYCASIGVTPAAFYCSAWGLSLSKLMNSDQVAFGMVFSGRDLPVANIHDTIGPCINTLPLFVSTANPDTLDSSTFVQNIFQTLCEHSKYQLVRPEDGVTRQYSSIMAFQYEMSARDYDSTYDIHPIGQSSFTMDSDVPVSVVIFEHGVVQIRYNRDRYNATDIQILGMLFQNATEALLHRDSSLLACLDQLISATERAELLHTSNCDSQLTFTKNSGEKHDIVTLFEGTANRYPESIAAVRGEQTITYQSFNVAADLVADSLSHVQPGDPICVIADRSINWLVGVFGILKARGVYVPLDPKVPSNVRNENFKRCGAQIYLATNKKTLAIGPPDASERLVVDDIVQSRKQQKEQQHSRREFPFPDDTAYICFTSGSTGKPKAVQCTHKGLAAFIATDEIRLHAKPGTKIAQTMSPVFDGSILEIFSALCYGATIHLAAENADHPFGHVKQCDVALFTPSVGNVLNPQDYDNLKHVYLVGEPVPQSVSDKWSKDKNLYNMYGPTESTCGATLKRLPPGEKVSIGYPNPSSRVYVLDRNQQLMPTGTVGEIYTAGIQVSQGYLNQPEETARRFSADSVVLDPNERMYQTGDLGYWDVFTKELHCKGRMDRQIKLRGFRIDLQDLEIRIARAVPESKDVAVYRKEDFLIALLRPASLEVSSVRRRILEEVPGYAAPRRIIVVDKFPLTVAGKLDYKSLEAIEPNTMDESEKNSLKGTENTIAQTWRELLRLGPEIDIASDTDFIALGGHSLLQIKLANALSRKFSRHVSIKTIIQNPSVQSLSVAMDAIADSGEAIKAMEGPRLGPRLGPHSVSPIEREWLRKYDAQLGSSAFNVSQVYKLNAATVDYERLCSSWDRVLAKHKILRSRFVGHAGGVRIYQSDPPRTEFVKRLDVRKLINHEFRLEMECPVQITVSPLYLVICISHIVCDLTTLRILLDEFSAYYRGFSPHSSVRQYEDTCWATKVDDTALDFWRAYLPKTHAHATLATKRAQRTFQGTSFVHKLAPSSQHTLNSIIETHNLTQHQVALAVVSLTLGSVLSSDVVFGSPFMGRAEEDENTVGLFLQPLPICIPKTTHTTPLHQYLASIRASSQSALANAIPWHAILECSAQSASTTSPFPHPFSEVMVTFHDERGGKSRRLSLDGFEKLDMWSEGAKFPLMFEFTLTQDSLIVRVEYSSELFTNEEIFRMVTLSESVLNVLEVGSIISVGEVVVRAKKGRRE